MFYLLIFLLSMILFHGTISLVYNATRLSNDNLMGIAQKLFLLSPVLFLLGYYLASKDGQTHAKWYLAILFYILIEILLDYILKIDFRSKLYLHIPYNIILYFALGSIIFIAFELDTRLGYFSILTTLVLLGSLIWLIIEKK
ncbi:MAG: hypothetical protein INQ03_23160 [Candidatus Heimdallarchaeota archaeon]|nr:hypothetical protein [Candidatus Heimdallarchaeota archaeon]